MVDRPIHNADTQFVGSSPTLLMANRAGRPEHTPEAEPVLVARISSEVILVLDDGTELRFDASELQHAVEGP